MWRYSARFGFGTAVVAALGTAASCGGKAVIDGSPGSGGNAATTTTVTTVDVSTSNVTASTGGTVNCDANEDCKADEFCDFPVGQCLGLGTCVPRPQQACPPACPGFCGCDGGTWCSQCDANAAGVDGPGPCAGPPQQARAAYLPTGAERVGMTLWDPAQGVCVYYGLLSGDGAGAFPEVEVIGNWNVEQITRVQLFTADDCLNWQFPVPLGADLEQVEGTIVVTDINNQPAGPACRISVATVVDFGGGSLVNHGVQDVLVEGGPCGAEPPPPPDPPLDD